jgi:RNAse (barnase) inhibitor barstar
MIPEHTSGTNGDANKQFVLVPESHAFHRESSAVPDEICIDFSGVTTESEVHELFFRLLPFPVFYGHNWDAFWDVLTGFDCFPRHLTLSGTDHLRVHVPRAYEQLQSCFADCQRTYPRTAPQVIWR